MGSPLLVAASSRRPTFIAWTSENEPPSTVKSCAKMAMRRPSTRPNPVTTPSPACRLFSSPKPAWRCSTYGASSSNESASSMRLMRSRAVSLPRACCASIRS